MFPVRRSFFQNECQTVSKRRCVTRHECRCIINGDDLKIGFNSKYLIDAVSSIEGKEVVLEFRGKQNPGVIRSSDGTNHTSVVMPMRI